MAPDYEQPAIGQLALGVALNCFTSPTFNAANTSLGFPQLSRAPNFPELICPPGLHNTQPATRRSHGTYLASYSAYPSAVLRSSTMIGFWWAHSVHSELQADSSCAGSRAILHIDMMQQILATRHMPLGCPW